jgi:lysophospholipase L1-like esterase
MSSSRSRRGVLTVLTVLAATAVPAVTAVPAATGATRAHAAGGGPRGTVTSSDTGAAALRLAVVGDSVAWGQGLADQHRASTLVARALAARTGRAVDVDVYAHSGATLSGPCPASGVTVPAELPFAAPSVACQLGTAAGAGHAYDLVLMSGCINDLTVASVLFGTAPLAQAVAGGCGQPLTAAVTAAHALPGRPRVVVTGYYPIVSHRTDPAAFAQALRTALAPGATAEPEALRRRAIRRSAEFAAAFDLVARRAVAPARGSAVFVSPGFGSLDALFAPRAKVWTGADDEVAAARAQACAALPSTLPGVTDATRQLCAVASVGHPNVAGAARYADRIEAAIARWFRPAIRPAR